MEVKEEKEGPSSSKRIKRDKTSTDHGKLKCFICEQSDNVGNITAGTSHARDTNVNKLCVTNVKEFTEDVKKMAMALNNQVILSKLAGGSVASKELIYHKSCYKDYLNKYDHVIHNQDFQQEETLKDDSDEFWKAFCFNKVVTHVRETYETGIGVEVNALMKLYKELLQEHGIAYTPQLTHFTDDIMRAIPQLEKRGKGKRKGKLYFKTGVEDLVLVKEIMSPSRFVEQLNKLVVPIRKKISEQKNRFNGTFSKDCQKASVPKELLSLISMLIDGTNHSSKLSQASLTCAQLIVSNYKPNMSDDEKKTLYCKDRETPLVIYNGLNLYGWFRSKHILNNQFHLGLSVPYLRIENITKHIADTVLKQFKELKCFVPQGAKKGVFTVIAKHKNIELNSTSDTTSKDTHGTGFSFIQFGAKESEGGMYNLTYIMDKTPGSLKVDMLPEDYLKISTFEREDTVYYAPKSIDSLDIPNLDVSIFQDAVQEEYKCLSEPIDYNHSRSSYSKKQSKKHTDDFVSSLPYLPDKKMNTMSMQCHCMNIITKTINEVNPSQTPVDVCEQPIYALTKRLIWRHDCFKRYFCLFDTLDVEKSSLALHDEFVSGSGLLKILEINNLPVYSHQTAPSTVTIKDIERARYTLQVSACVIYKKLVDAHANSDSLLSVLDWLNLISTQSVMALYWKQILELQLDILIYIRSIREGNFHLHVLALRSLIKWYFALDHSNFSRWLTVHLFDLVNLEKQHPDVYENFCKGYFTLYRSSSEFTLTTLDQIHDAKKNGILKDVGRETQQHDAVDDSDLIRWELCGNEVNNMISSFEECLNEDEGRKRMYSNDRDDNQSFRRRIVEDVEKVSEMFLVNPFISEDFTAVNNKTISFDGRVIQSIKTLSSVGEEQIKEFWEKRLVTAEVPISDDIKKNNIRLPKHMLALMNVDKKDPTLTNKMVSYLRSAYRYRPEAVKELFKSEIFGIAQSISSHKAELYYGTKSEITRRFKTTTTQVSSSNSGIVIELSPIIKSKQNIICDTFDDFAEVVYGHISVLLQGYQRCDVVADRYFNGSLKEGTRKKRGDSGSIVYFTGERKFPTKFGDFLNNSENKNKLSQFLAGKMLDLHAANDENSLLKFVSTFKDTILTNDTDLASQSDINSCTAEEADPRLIRHAINQAKNGIECITIETVDSDVLILAISYVRRLMDAGATSVFIRLCQKEYNLIEVYEKFGSDICKALPFFHSFTGCDTVSSFYGKGKLTMFDAWMTFPKSEQLTKIFIELGDKPAAVSKENLSILEEFLLFVYFGRDHKYTDINDARCISFFKSPDPKLRETILSRNAFCEHVKRACYQTGWLWKECVTNITLPDPEVWGWQTNSKSNLKYTPRWISGEAPTTDIKTVTSTCSCKTICINCKCLTTQKKCLEYCKCERVCKNV